MMATTSWATCRRWRWMALACHLALAACTCSLAAMAAADCGFRDCHNSPVHTAKVVAARAGVHQATVVAMMVAPPVRARMAVASVVAATMETRAGKRVVVAKKEKPGETRAALMAELKAAPREGGQAAVA